MEKKARYYVIDCDGHLFDCIYNYQASLNRMKKSLLDEVNNNYEENKEHKYELTSNDSFKVLKQMTVAEYKAMDSDLRDNYFNDQFDKNIRKKETTFSNLCKDWDFRLGVDMFDQIHLSGISIDKDTIKPMYERYSHELDEYIYCSGEIIHSPTLVKKFISLDLSDEKATLNFIDNIENYLDYETMNDKMNAFEDNWISEMNRNKDMEL